MRTPKTIRMIIGLLLAVALVRVMVEQLAGVVR